MHLVGFLSFHSSYRSKVDQTLAWDLAQKFEERLYPLAFPVLKLPELEAKIFELQEINPRVAIFLLNSEGRVICSGTEDPWDIVPLAPIREFLATRGFPRLPLYGPDPSIESLRDRRSTFSVAPIRLEHETGYVYVVLRGPGLRVADQMAGDFMLAASSVTFFVILAIATTFVGMVLSSLFLSRFRKLTEAILSFTAGDYSTRVPCVSDDEVGLHASAFNQMATKIEENVHQLKEIDEQRRNFIAGVTHDLRKPLTFVRGSLETLLEYEEEVDEEQRKKYLRSALDNSVLQQRLIDDLFELSKLEAKDSTPSKEQFELSHLLESCERNFAHQAREKAISLSLINDAPGVRVYADRTMVERVLANLVDNAVRYCPRDSSVQIAAQRSNDLAQIQIIDTGPGIPADELPRIFDRFYRGKSTAGKKTYGSGLGLAIVKTILEAHGQEIQVDSTVGKGTTFTFWLEVVQFEKND